jgi:trans-L-3-hydroxyproline dehydratase
VPSFVSAIDQFIEIPNLGLIRYDLAFGGAFYAYVRADQLGLTCTVDEYASLVRAGMTIKRAIMESRPVVHPVENDLSFLYGTIFISPPQSEGADTRNVCVFADGQIDRSPTGTGMSGRLALEYFRGALALHQPFVVESIIGTRFTGRVVGVTTCGGQEAIIPEIEGSAHITGRHEFLIDPDDPLKYGFLFPYHPGKAQ